MLCYAMLCYAMLCYAMRYYAMLCYGMMSKYELCSVIIAVCAWYCGLLESAVWPSTAGFSSLGRYYVATIIQMKHNLFIKS